MTPAEAIAPYLDKIERDASWLYKRVGMSRMRWSRCMRGVRPFRHEEAEAIARALRTTARRLFPAGSVLPPGRQRQSPKR